MNQCVLKLLYPLLCLTLMLVIMTLNNDIPKSLSHWNADSVTVKDGQGTHLESVNNSKSAMLPMFTSPSPVIKKRKRKIYARFKSRFGNTLFQFAAIYGLAMDTDSESYFTDNGCAMKIINMFPTTAEYIHFVKSIPENISTVKELAPNRYTHKVEEKISNLNNEIYVNGWLGVWGYWWPKYEKQIRKIFKISEKLQNCARAYLFIIAKRIIPSSLLESRINNKMAGTSQNTAADGLTLVGIQIRRGDKVNSVGWRLPSQSYFIHAMKYFRSKYNNTYFIVVSEDKMWAKANIEGPNVVHSSSKDALLELTLLSLCDHTIMSVGTFSWWAAWLADGETVYYKHHTKANTGVARFFNDSQYFLPHWIPMD